MEQTDSLEYKRAILEYWTLVEFFSPYMLEDKLKNKQTCEKIYADQQPKPLLPWLDAPLIKENDPTTPFAKGYFLYLGLFSIKETADRARHSFAKQPSQWQSIDWKNCLSASSITCFARLTVTTHGIPLFGTLSLSTLPWAHGRLLIEEKDSLTLEKYWKSVNRFILSLREKFSAELPTKLVKEPGLIARYLDLDFLCKLTELLYEWAGYQPQGYPIALIETLSADKTFSCKDPQISTERDIPILNSFYIQDLEAAAISLSAQKETPIDIYLSGKQNKRIFLESEEGAQIILNTIRPEKTPSGRWPNRISHQQNLMQQFAINATLDTLKVKGVFSVNGPPGTGKTSLLREIIAANIVLRAEALANFKTAKDAFIGQHALNFENHDPVFVSALDPSLLGYEMLIVSSNNTAVQNLSQELPLRSLLDPTFQNASYLEMVAAKSLELKEKEVWGLISATLGNMENCRRFVESVFMKKEEEDGKARIWEWIEKYEGPSFIEAIDAFITIKKRHKDLSDEFENLAWLHDEIGGRIVESYCKEALDEFAKAEKETERIEACISRLYQEEEEAKELLTLLEEKNMLWLQERPNALMRMMNRKSSKAWSKKKAAFGQERIAMIEVRQKCKNELMEQRKQLEEKREIESDKRERLLDQALFFYSYQEAYDALKKAHPTVQLPNSLNELAGRDAQTQSYYQTKEMNSARSDLFIAALTLHEAWLAEVLRMKRGLRGNLMAISNILQGKSPSTSDDTRLVWQSVFLLIPVISSTFASIGRLFRYLEPGTLGWVLIDEAGQAIPQAAVGAIWRAQRVLSIGDPFQIEPICIVPPEVIDGMAKSKIKDYTLSWAPSQVSVQNLMDRASIFGLERMIQEQIYWLGSPLRVHRRCLEPMFTIANSIAYDSSMLLATDTYQEIILPPSCWWDIGGYASERQYVPEQGQALSILLKEMFVKMDTPDLYVVSPFREVIVQIQRLLLNDKELREIFKRKFPTIPLSVWVKQGVGTVHTFQGKQAAAVFFVLGADKKSLGAIEWASRKPNLLNVAVTRAQYRFYMIGDYDLWRKWPYFDVAAKKLKRCSPSA